ncbi:hypothetical protein DSECCO2_349350 [anaerobic digester metagenome]
MNQMNRMKWINQLNRMKSESKMKPLKICACWASSLRSLPAGFFVSRRASAESFCFAAVLRIVAFSFSEKYSRIGSKIKPDQEIGTS